MIPNEKTQGCGVYMGMEDFGVLWVLGFCGIPTGFTMGIWVWVWGLKYNPQGSPVNVAIISKTVQDRDTHTMELVCALSSGVIFSDLE